MTMLVFKLAQWAMVGVGPQKARHAGEGHRRGVILAVVHQPPAQVVVQIDGGACERFRPRYALDLEILTPESARNESFPIYEAAPLPVAAGCGMEAGLFAFPDPGCLVVIGFAYGRPDHPIVRQVYPLDLSLPGVTAGRMRWQQTDSVFQEADPDGNWRRTTDQAITDESLNRITRAVEAISEIAREVRTIEENSTEEVGGIKLLKAFGALKLLPGGQANLSAVDNLNLTTARDFNLIAAGDRFDVAGSNHTARVKGDRFDTVTGSRTIAISGDDTLTIEGGRTETITGSAETAAAASTETITGSKQITAGSIELLAPTITIGAPGGGTSLLPLISSFMASVIDALNVLATHTHPEASACSQGGQVSSDATAIQSYKSDLDGISE
jgi:hypothetical protein